MSRKIYVPVFDCDHAFTHGGAMDYPQVIHRMLGQLNVTQEELAELFETSQPTISRWLKGAKPTAEHHELIRNKAIQLGILDMQGQLINQGGEDDTIDGEPVGHTVAIVGYVGAGAQAHYYDAGQGPFGRVEMPPRGTLDLVAVVVRGDSMGGVADDEATIYYRDRREPPTEELFGRLCVCGLPDGRVLLKKMRPSRATPGLFDLYSTTGETLPNQEVSWAAKVEFIKPA